LIDVCLTENKFNFYFFVKWTPIGLILKPQ